MFIASIIDERAFRVGPSDPLYAAHQPDASHDPFFPLPLGMCSYLKQGTVPCLSTDHHVVQTCYAYRPRPTR